MTITRHNKFLYTWKTNKKKKKIKMRVKENKEKKSIKMENKNYEYFCG